MEATRIAAGLVLFGALAAGCQHDRPKARTAEQLSDRAQLARTKDGKQQINQVNAEKLKLVAAFWGPMPTGVTVSRSGRTFMNFPRWGDRVEFTVAEVKNGKVSAYPGLAINKIDDAHPKDCLISVQSVVCDEQDRLWILDTGSINMQPPKAGGPKLLCVDLSQDKVVKTIDFSKGNAVLPTTYLNDIRFDLNRGKAGLAFITDSSDSGANGIIVVDLDSGESWRRLNDHPSTKAQQNFAPNVEGQELMARPPQGPAAYMKIGTDGIAISADKKTLFYCPLAGRHLYSVSVDALADRSKSDEDVAKTVKDLGDRGYASDGLETDKQGALYLTDYEHNAIHIRDSNGDNDRVLVSDPRMIWPDSMCAAADGFLYFTANQLNRQAKFHEGKDLRVQPYSLFKFPLHAATRSETVSAHHVNQGTVSRIEFNGTADGRR